MDVFFVDSLTAYHHSITVQSDGSKRNQRDAEPFLSDVRCQLSFSGDAQASPKGQATYPLQRSLKIFVNRIDLGLRSGDWVIVKRRGTVAYEGAIGEPTYYDRLIPHIELTIDAWKEVKSNG